MVNQSKTYTSLASTLHKSICNKMAAKKRFNLIKSCIITSKQRCANTRNRLLVTLSLLRDTENVEHSKHFKNLSIYVSDEKERPGNRIGIPRKNLATQGSINSAVYYLFKNVECKALIPRRLKVPIDTFDKFFLQCFATFRIA